MVRILAVSLVVSIVSAVSVSPPPAMAAEAGESSEELTLEGLAEYLARDPFFDDFTNAELAAYLMEAKAFLAADAQGTQALLNNEIVTGPGTLHAEIRDSVIGSAGLFGINQSAGEANNQANLTSLAFAGEIPSFNMADANARQILLGNTLSTAASTDAAIVNSFNNTTGIVQLNQAAGSLNNQINVLALAVGGGLGPIGALLADAQLASVGGEAENELTIEEAIENRGTITNSFNNFRGIAQVSQVSGSLNQVGNVLGASIQTTGVTP